MSARNPLASDQVVCDRIRALSPAAKAELYAFSRWLYLHARDQAEKCWRQKKAPMAVYWSAVKAWSFHASRILRARVA